MVLSAATSETRTWGTPGNTAIESSNRGATFLPGRLLPAFLCTLVHLNGTGDGVGGARRECESFEGFGGGGGEEAPVSPQLAYSMSATAGVGRKARLGRSEWPAR